MQLKVLQQQLKLRQLGLASCSFKQFALCHLRVPLARSGVLDDQRGHAALNSMHLIKFHTPHVAHVAHACGGRSSHSELLLNVDARRVHRVVDAFGSWRLARLTELVAPNGRT